MVHDILLYQLKHRFRSRIDLVRVDRTESNLETGRREATQSVLPLDPVVEVSNNWLLRVYKKTDVDVNTKGWLIDPHDLPDDFTPEKTDKIQDYGPYPSERIVGVYHLESSEWVNGAILIIGKRLRGSERNAAIEVSAQDILSMGETSD